MYKKNVLLIINSGLLNSGVPKVVFDIVSALYEKYDFDILVQSNKKEYYDDKLLYYGCNIIYFGNPVYGRKRYFYDLTIRLLKTLWIVRRKKYDIIHSFTGYQAGVDCLAGFLAGSNVRIANIHGVVSSTNTLVTGSYERICCYLIKRFATNRIGVSEQAASSLYKGMNYEVIYNSVRFDEYQKIAKEVHAGINLIQIGYYNENKNQLYSLNILRELKKQNQKVCLYFIGYDMGNGYYDQMLNYIVHNELTDNVIFLNHDYDKKKILPYIDYMLQPSIFEGLSLTALECQASCIPCIVSDAIPEIVNIGFLHRIPLIHMNAWVSFIRDGDGKNDHIEEQKTTIFSRTRFLDSFDKIYRQ